MNRTILFLQCTNAGQYPPIMNAARLAAGAGWRVLVLSFPSADTCNLTMEDIPGVEHIALATRPYNRVRAPEYAVYVGRAVALAARVQPSFIYASDLLGALPALAAARVCRAEIIYHEHDTPPFGTLRSTLARWRAAITRKARIVILPHADRARLVQAEFGLSEERLSVIWNVPSLSELPPLPKRSELPFTLYYHGSITPDRLPLDVACTLPRYEGVVRLQIVGYEAPSAIGYVNDLLEASRDHNGALHADYIGQVPRPALLRVAAKAHIGLAFMPMVSDDINMRFMAGASNKAFDYMAAGLPMLVSDLAEWREMFVNPGFAMACRPNDAGTINAAIAYLLDRPELQQAMAVKCRYKIEREWNYDTQFRPILSLLERMPGR